MLIHKVLGATDTAGTFTFLSSTPGYVNGASGVTLTYPVGIQAGDLLLVTGLIQSASLYGTVSGWTNVGTAGSYGTISYKVATGSESGNLTVTWSGNGSAVHTMIVIRHSSGITPQVVQNNGTVATNPSVTLAGPGVSYNQLAHVINYIDNAALNMVSVDANLNLLQYRTNLYGSWIGWINTSALNKVNSVITSNSNSVSVSVRVFSIYV